MSAQSKGYRGTGSTSDVCLWEYTWPHIPGVLPSCLARRLLSWQVLAEQAPWQSSPVAPPDPAHTPSPTASPGLHPALISACCLAVPWRLRGQRSPLSPSLYTPVIFNSAYANPESGMSSGRGPRGNGHGANFLPFLPLFLYNIQQRFSSTS